MSDRTFTFFELHLHDGISLPNSAPASLRGRMTDSDSAEGETDRTSIDVEAGEEAEGPDESAAQSGSGGSKLKSLFVLLLFVSIAVAAKKFLGGEDLEDLEDLEELDDLAEEV